MNKTTLHTVNQSPFSRDTLALCLAHHQAGDAIVLLEDGVYGALADQKLATLTKTTCYAIAADIDARGLKNMSLATNIELIDYDRFVQLCCDHARVHSWY